MKKLLQILTTSVVGAFLMVGVVGATSSTSYCSIYKSGSTSYKSCQTNTNTTSVQVVCENNVYVINDNSQNAGTGSATIKSNGSGGYVASGSATNTSGATVNIGASCGQTAAASSSTSSSSSSTCSSSKTCPSSSKSAAAGVTSSPAAAGSLPETGSNTVVDAAILGTALLVGGLVISYVGTALYRRAALKD